ncbi:MAG: ImmA/IrrE family metallo-endopeptidase [Ilumatobacteraceae bacterium]|nr:ImmA/IrrE family metallo-endopeptidase [Ilumatobacteraceae bacterium]
MAPQGGRWQRRIEAAQSAVRLLDELTVDQTEQIDVFGMCEDLGLWLAFLPMDNLLGAFVPEGVGGVLVTTQRSIPIQRYTAAHEIGHWRLDFGHGIALDGEEHIFGTNPAEREQLAQVFAANLLMPAPLIFALIDRLGVEGESIKPEHAYAVAREAGVSYEAAVRQLTHLELITPDHAFTLRSRLPLRVKTDLALGRRPVNGYADVWPVNEDWDDQLLALRVEDEVLLSLPENRSTGYRWIVPSQHLPGTPAPAPAPFAAESPIPTPAAVADLRSTIEDAGARARKTSRAAINRLRTIEPSPPLATQSHRGADFVGDEYLPARAAWLPPRKARQARLDRLAGQHADELARADDAIIAGTGRRILGIRFGRPGPTTIRLEYRNPYDDSEPVDEYTLHAIVEPRRVGFSVDQLADEDDAIWTHQFRQRQLDRPLDPIIDSETLPAGDDEA